MTIPYLIRVIGVDNFGLLAFVTAIIMQFKIITDYGFDLSATRQISENRSDLKKINEVYSSVLIVKIALTLFCFVFLLLLSFFNILGKDSDIYILTFGMVVGYSLFPVWLFQGMEDMRHIAYINIFAKTIFTICIFIYVQEKEDYWMVPLFNSAGLLFAGVWSLKIANKKFQTKFKMQSFGKIVEQIKSGWHVFISRLYVNLYTTANIIILGLLSTNEVVGYYSVSEKILFAISGLFLPIMQGYYPYLVKIYSISKEAFFKKIDQLINFSILASIILTVLALIFSNEIIFIVSGGSNQEMIEVFMILALSIVSSPFGALFTRGLLVLKRDAIVSSVIKSTLILNTIIVFPLIFYFEAKGLAAAWVVGRIFHAVLYYVKFNIIAKGIISKMNFKKT